VKVRLVDVTPVLRAACAEAMRTGHPHIGSEHLAMLALPGPDGLVAIALEAGIDATGAAEDLAQCCHDLLGSLDQGTEPRLTPRTARLAACAAQLAVLERSFVIQPVNLAAALLSEPGAVAWMGLLAAGITPAVVATGIERRRPRWRGDCGSDGALRNASRERAWATTSELVSPTRPIRR